MLVPSVNFTQQGRKLRHQPIANGNPLRREKLLLRGFGELRRHHCAQVVMMVVLTRCRLFIVMVTAMLGFTDMRAELLAAMLQRHVRAGTEPGEQHECRDELAG